MANINVQPGSSGFLEEFIEKILLVPNDVNRFLRLIRFLDKRLEKLQKILSKEQKDILQKVSVLKDKDKKLLSTSMDAAMKENPNFSEFTNKKIPPPSNLPLPLQEIFTEYIGILNLEKQALGYARQKSAVSAQLTSLVRQYFELLEKEVRSKIFKQLRAEDPNASSGLQEMPIQDLINHMKKKKQFLTATITNTNRKNTDFFYDPKGERFCICGEQSYGDMVFCENLYCEREWFHLSCLKESNLPEKWYCPECQKMKDKTKNPISKSYFSIGS